MFVSTHDALVMVRAARLRRRAAAYAAAVLARSRLADVQRCATACARSGRAAATCASRPQPATSCGAGSGGQRDDRAARRARGRARRVRGRAPRTWSRRSPTTCARRSRRCACWPTRSRTTSSTPTTRRRYLEQMSVHIRSLSALSTTCSSSRGSRPETSSGRCSRCGSTSSWRRRSRPCARRRTPSGVAVQRRGAATTSAPPAAEPREAPARPLQPDPERHPPHARRRQRDRGSPRSNGGRCRGRGGRHRRGPRRPGSASGSSSRSSAAATAHARSGGGTGLGLTICRAIVEAHGGEIWLAESASGTRVRFSLPRAG